MIIISIYCISMYQCNDIEIKVAAQYDVVVTKVNQKEDCTNFIGRIDGELVNVYLSDRTEIKPGDLYTIKGELSKPLRQTVPGNFSYKNYLLSKGIKYQLFAEEYTYINSSFHIGIFRYNISNYIDHNMPLSKSYIKTFILADKSDFDQSTIDNVNKLGISHLFAVSGLHVGLLVLTLKKIFEIVKVNKLKSEIIISVILVVYVIVTSFSPSVVRAGTMFVAIVMNDRLKLKLSNLDLLSLIFIISLILNPYFYMNPGFVLSFAVTFSLLLSYNIFSKYSQLELLFMVGYVSFIFTLPIVLNMNYQINLLTLFFNVLFILYMSYIILPLSYVCFVIPMFDTLLYRLITLYNSLINTMSQINLTIINGAFVNDVYIIVFYIFVISYFCNFNNVVQKKRIFAMLFLFTLFTMNSQHFNPVKSVSFLDVHGDATLILDRFDRCNILVDTGETDDFDSVINYIRSKNVKRLDYLIVSHFHSDHYGEMEDISNEFNVVNTITSDNIEMYHGSDISCGSISFHLYKMSTLNQNENNNSLIMSLIIDEKHYLFTGDSELKREIEFKEKYNLEVDYLKVPHHGSSTSSSDVFLNSIQPKEAYVMVHRNNKFNHPDYFVVKRYNQHNITLYRTDILGTIEVQYIFGRERKKYNMP